MCRRISLRRMSWRESLGGEDETQKSIHMKKYIFAAFTILFSFAANASHHRGHAIGFADSVIFNLNLMEKRLDNYVAICTLTPAQETSVEVLYRYSGFVKDSLTLTIGILNNQSGDLDDARRRVNRPNQSPPNSVSNLMLGLAHRARMLVTACPEGNGYLAGVIQRISLAWEAVDLTIWHINDAIREEIYQDPNFVCSGPNNHC